MKPVFVAIAALAVLTPRLALPEEPRPRRFHVAPILGAYVPTGAQRGLLSATYLDGLTAWYDLTPHLALVVACARARPRVSAVGQRVDLFQYDVGVQAQYPLDLGKGVTLEPFAGVGVGARTYRFRHLAVDAEVDLADYLAAGVSLEYRSIAVAVTVRDSLSGYGGIGLSPRAGIRNDLFLMETFGFRF